jgi:Crp-like helix-turn-helix domain
VTLDGPLWVNVLEQLSQEDRRTAFCVLFMIVADYLDDRNQIRVSQAELGKRLGVGRVMVNRAMQQLSVADLIRRQSSRHLCMLNPTFHCAGPQVLKHQLKQEYGWIERRFKRAPSRPETVAEALAREERMRS